MATEIEHGDRECPVCGALPGEECTLPHDRRLSLQPPGRSHLERGWFEHAHEVRRAEREAGKEADGV